MVARTRSVTNSPAKKPMPAAQASNNTAMSKNEACKIVIAPKMITEDSRILLLQRPRDGLLQRYLFCPGSGVFELIKISAPSTEPRSVLLTGANPENSSGLEAGQLGQQISDGYVVKNAEVMIATRYDLTFLLLRLLAPKGKSTKEALFQPIDDLLDIPESEDKQFRYILYKDPTAIEKAMSSICDIIDAGDEKMFRYNEQKVFQMWIKKAQRVAKQGLPSSLEDRFVSRALEVPILSVKRDDSARSTTTTGDLENNRSSQENLDSQSSIASSNVSTTFSSASSEGIEMTEIIESPINDNHRDLQRLKTALDFISSSYLPLALADRLQQTLLSNESPIDFKPLERHMSYLASLRSEALASRSFSDFSRKRLNTDDDEAADIKAEKRRKLDEEEKKRKANESRGVRDLKKVNVSGMKKMSQFFSKKPVVEKT